MANPLPLHQMTVLQIRRACKILNGSSLLVGKCIHRRLELLNVPHELTLLAKQVIGFLLNSIANLYLAKRSYQEC